MSNETVVQVSYKGYGDSFSHYVVASDDNGFMSMRRADTEEWTPWCRGEPVADIACHGNGLFVDLHRTDRDMLSLNLDYDEAENLYLALHEHFHRNQKSYGKIVVRRFEEAD